jgi:DNA-binding transcriptional LysR family regulator
MPWDERTKRRLKLRDLEILMAVIQAGSMRKAAEHLNMFQPTISKSVADLEHALGVRLLERSRQGIEATAYGVALARRGAAVFDELQQGVQDIDFIADPTAGELRIATTENMIGGLLPAVIDRISRQYPRIAFLVTQGSALEQFLELREREADLIIGRLPRSIEENDLDVQILFDDPFLVGTAAKNRRWDRRRRVELSDLIEEPWVLPWPNRYVGGLVADIFRANGLDIPLKRVACSSMQMSNSLVATGRYLSFYSGSYLRFSEIGPSIKVLPVTLAIRSGPVGIVTLKKRMVSPVARLFIDAARELAKPLARRQR